MPDYFDFDIYNLKRAGASAIISECNKPEIKFIIILKSDKYSTEMIDFLTKILASISVDLFKDCTIISFDNLDILSFENIFKSGISKHIISFGIDEIYYDIQASLKKRAWNHFENFSVLVFDDLQNINNNQDLKRKLWEQLKLV